MNNYLIYLCLIITLFVTSCDEEYNIVICNNSQESIYYVIGGNTSSSTYPYYSLPSEDHFAELLVSNDCNEETSIFPWNELIERSPNDSLCIFIIDNEIFRDSSWVTIRENDLVLDRIFITIDLLEQNDFKVYYP
ncbi:MAG: hypothetical protein H6578_11055 [Chitinophagales bacterium]|nr:hypothetical protein [Chitinophagales bacterium]